MMRHHLMLSSQQLWPNLLGLSATLQRDGGGRSIPIVHTADARHSARPGRALQRLCARLAHGIEPAVHLTGTTSQELPLTIAPLIREASRQGEPWSVTATGGTKTVFAGLANFARVPEVEMLHREVAGQWYHLGMMTGGQMELMACEDWPGAAPAAVTLPAQDLVAAQCATDDGSSGSRQPVPRVDPLRVIRKGIESKWHWPRIIGDQPALRGITAGFAFEAFFGALVWHLGRGNTVLNLTRRAGPQALAEFDVVACTGQRIVIFDLKLPDAASDSARFDQIFRLHSNRDSLGGLGATAVSVRPGWPHDPNLHALARGLGVDVWDESIMPKLIPLLSSVLQCPQSAAGSDLAEVDSCLQTSAASGARVFTSSRCLPVSSADQRFPELTTGVVNLSAYAADVSARGLHATATRLAGRWFIRFSIPPYRWKTSQAMECDLPGGCCEAWFRFSASGAGASALLKAAPERGTALARWVEHLLTGGSS